MKNYKITVTTNLTTYCQTYSADHLDHAWKLVQEKFIRADAFVFKGDKNRIHIPRTAVLEVKVEEIA